MEALSPVRRMFVDGFIVSARNICQDIMQKHALRNQPFSDSVLRQMAIRLPTTKDEMLSVPGINPTMAKQFSHKLITLIKSTRSALEHQKEGNHGPAAQRPRQQTESLQYFKPHDPNHETVIDLTEDMDEMEEDMELSDDDGALEQSHYFSGRDCSPPDAYVQVDSDVQRFNQHFNISQNRAAPAQAKPQGRSNFYPKRGRKSGGRKGSFQARKTSNSTNRSGFTKSGRGGRSGGGGGSGFMGGIKAMA